MVTSSVLEFSDEPNGVMLHRISTVLNKFVAAVLDSSIAMWDEAPEDVRTTRAETKPNAAESGESRVAPFVAPYSSPSSEVVIHHVVWRDVSVVPTVDRPATRVWDNDLSSPS
jgi:hypothetical protein